MCTKLALQNRKQFEAHAFYGGKQRGGCSIDVCIQKDILQGTKTCWLTKMEHPLTRLMCIQSPPQNDCIQNSKQHGCVGFCSLPWRVYLVSYDQFWHIFCQHENASALMHLPRPVLLKFLCHKVLLPWWIDTHRPMIVRKTPKLNCQKSRFFDLVTLTFGLWPWPSNLI